MALGKVSGCVLMAVCLFAMVDAADTQQDNPLHGPGHSFSVVGSNATFTCASSLRNCVGMSWYKYISETDRETIFNEHKGIYLRDKYIVETSSVGCELTVTNVAMEDSGYVTCEIVISGRTFNGTAPLVVFRYGATSDLKQLRMVQLAEKMAAFVPLKGMTRAMNEENSTTKCFGFTCKCCWDIKIPYTSYSFKSCLLVTYRPQTQTVIVEGELSRRPTFKEEFPVSETITDCRDNLGAGVCWWLYDIQVDKETFTGCAKLTFNNLLPYKPECLRINFSKPPMPRWYSLWLIIENSEKTLYTKKENSKRNFQAIEEA